MSVYISNSYSYNILHYIFYINLHLSNIFMISPNDLNQAYPSPYLMDGMLSLIQISLRSCLRSELSWLATG